MTAARRRVIPGTRLTQDPLFNERPDVFDPRRSAVGGGCVVATRGLTCECPPRLTLRSGQVLPGRDPHPAGHCRACGRRIARDL